MNYDIPLYAKSICTKLELWRSPTFERDIADEALQEEGEMKLDYILLPGLCATAVTTQYSLVESTRNLQGCRMYNPWLKPQRPRPPGTC
jgi:hypothetical protein